jgi:anthranilate phosphoribosyltransferase
MRSNFFPESVGETFGYKMTNMPDLHGGSTVQEAASIFINVLQGKGTETQTNVVIANTQLALMCYYQGKSHEVCKDMAEDSLKSGKALRAFNKLIEMQV